MDLRDRILLQPWAINLEYALTYQSAMVALLEGRDPFPATDKSRWRQRNRTLFIKQDDEGLDDDGDGNDELVDNDDTDGIVEENTISEGSVAHMRLRGPIVKYNQFCGPRGTVDYAQELTTLANDPNCIGGVFEIESGGGEFYAVKPLADAMKYFKSKKPLIVLGGDFLCSAAYYLAVYADEVWFNHPKAIIGSIGTMISFADVKPYFEKQGIVFHEIYATASSLKNKTTSEAYKGNYKPIIDKMLDPVNNDFIDDVKLLRGKNLNSNKAILQGETFFGTVALNLGMVDAQGDLKGAVSRVRELAAKPKPATTTSTQQTNMKYPKLTALLTALEGGATATQEELEVVNAELSEAGITSVGLFHESLATDAAQATTDLAAQTAEVTRLSTELTGAKESVTSLTTENTTLKAKVAKAPAAAAPVTGKTDPATEESAEQKGAKIINSLPHNQGLLDNPLFQKN